jgi:hypothetical protein
VAAFSYPIVGARAVTTERLDSAYARKCKAQMRSIASIQDEHSIKDIMKAQGIPDFQAPPPIPTFIDTTHAIDELPSYDSFEPSLDDF